MTTQPTKAAELPEALRPEMLDDLIATFESAGRGNYNLMRVELARHPPRGSQMTDTKTPSPSPSPSDAELVPCPFCGSKEVNVADDLITFYGECGACGATAAYSSYRTGAVQAWNRRAPQPAPVREPLTLEQIERIYQRYGGDMVNCTRSIERHHGITT